MDQVLMSSQVEHIEAAEPQLTFYQLSMISKLN